MGRPFSEKEREEKRQLILDKAEELFVKYGFVKITIQDITEAANIGKGTFYSFYKSKGALFVDIYAREWTRLQEHLLKKYKNMNGNLEDLVVLYIKENRKNLMENPVLSIIYNRDTLEHISDKYGRQGLIDFSELNKSVLIELLRSWTKDKEIELNIREEILSGMMRSLSYLIYHKDEIGDDIFEEVIQTFIDAISLEIKANIVVK